MPSITGRLSLLCVVLAAAAFVAYRSPRVVLFRAGRLLEGSYTEGRPFDYRLPGSGYCKADPGRSDGRLLRSAVGLLRENASTLDSRWEYHALLGRAALLAGEPDAAVRHYRRALESEPAAEQAKLELSGAYMMRGAAEHRAIDLAVGLQLAGEVHQFKPRTAVEAFNLALLYESIPAPHLSTEEWKRCADMEAGREWRSEARERWKAAQAVVDERGRRMDAAVTVASFVAESARRPYSAEFALETVVPVWMETSAGGHGIGEMQDLASRLIREHRDEWLEDVLHSRRDGLAPLGRAIRANREGAHDVAIVEASEASLSLRNVGNRAGELRAMLEEVYALQRLERGHECLGKSGYLRKELAPTQYPWLKLQAALEESTCKAKTESSGAIRAQRESLLAEIKTTGYKGLELRGMGFLIQPDLVRANPLRLWKIAGEGLRRFWKDDYMPARAQQLYIATAVASRRTRIPLAAIAMAREGTRVMEAIPNPQWRALCVTLLGSMETEAGWHADAAATFARAGVIFAGLPQTDPVRQFRQQAELHRIAARVQAYAEPELLPQLRLLLNSAAEAGISRHVLIGRQASGYLSFRTGDVDGARQDLRAAVDLVMQETAKVEDQPQRDGWIREGDSAVRTYVELLLQRDGNAAAAMDQLLEYRAARRRGRDAATYSEAPPGSAAIAVVKLSSGTAVLARRGSTAEWRWISGPREMSLYRAAARFASMCSTPESPLLEVRRAGQSLYRELIEPFEPLLTGVDRLGVSAEGELNAIPWAALVDARGSYAAGKWAVMLTDQPRRATGAAAISFGARPLLVAEPAVDRSAWAALPPLTDVRAEAASIASQFGNARVLVGREATAEKLKALLPGATFFHFAGHGFFNGGFGALLMAPDKTETLDGVLAAETIARLDLTRVGLVCLAACATGVGEATGPLNADSLVRAFLDAGAGRVIAALWDVSSAPARPFMEEFYRWLPTERPSEALRKAQAAALADGKTRHPYHWAVFQMYAQSLD